MYKKREGSGAESGPLKIIQNTVQCSTRKCSTLISVRYPFIWILTAAFTQCLKSGTWQFSSIPYFSLLPTWFRAQNIQTAKLSLQSYELGLIRLYLLSFCILSETFSPLCRFFMNFRENPIELLASIPVLFLASLLLLSILLMLVLLLLSLLLLAYLLFLALVSFYVYDVPIVYAAVHPTVANVLVASSYCWCLLWCRWRPWCTVFCWLFYCCWHCGCWLFYWWSCSCWHPCQPLC